LQRVSGLCPDPLGSPWQGREERRIGGWREVASGPQDFWQIAATDSDSKYANTTRYVQR